MEGLKPGPSPSLAQARIFRLINEKSPNEFVLKVVIGLLNETSSDDPILGLRPRTARTEGFLGGPRPHKDRSSKTKRPAVFFGP